MRSSCVLRSSVHEIDLNSWLAWLGWDSGLVRITRVEPGSLIWAVSTRFNLVWPLRSGFGQCRPVWIWLVRLVLVKALAQVHRLIRVGWNLTTRTLVEFRRNSSRETRVKHYLKNVTNTVGPIIAKEATRDNKIYWASFEPRDPRLLNSGRINHSRQNIISRSPYFVTF